MRNGRVMGQTLVVNRLHVVNHKKPTADLTPFDTFLTPFFHASYGGTLRSELSFAKATEGTHLAVIHGFTPVAFCEGG
jgi:hypothetical protein